MIPYGQPHDDHRQILLPPIIGFVKIINPKWFLLEELFLFLVCGNFLSLASLIVVGAFTV